MGMAKTYYHIWRHNHPLTSYFRVPRVPGFWLIAISVINPRVTEVVFTNLAKFMFINKLILAGLNQNSINNIISIFLWLGFKSNTFHHQNHFGSFWLGLSHHLEVSKNGDTWIPRDTINKNHPAIKVYPAW